MSKDIIARLQILKLYKQLEEKDRTLSALVERIVENVGPLLTRIPESMPDFTLHDPNHSAKVAENMGKIIPDAVLSKLNAIELTLLLLSAYLHDIGMTSSHDEKEEIIQDSEDFKTLFRSDVDKRNKFEYYRVIADHRAATFIEDQVFMDYLRQNHVRRSADFIRKNLGEGRLEVSFHGIPFWDLLIDICDAHGAPVEVLRNSDRWPRHTLIGENIINVQYLALVLRLADILDLDAERTPRMIYEFVNPKDPVSILEWKKHRSVIGHSIGPKTVLFEARCSSPEVERALKQFLTWIELERKGTMALLESYKDEIATRYYLELKEEVQTDRIKTNGSYLSNDLKFEIDYKRVLDLLIGERFYKNPVVAIRELLQNSVDAIRIRQKIYEGRPENFIPMIRVTLKDAVLTVEDNGVGMSEEIFRNYFLQVGKSYYSSREFYRKYAGVDVASEFGIGVLSCFMLAYSMEVESRRVADNQLEVHNPIRFEIPTAYGYLIQRKSERGDFGTRISLKLKDEALFQKYSLLDIIKEIIPDPPFPISVVGKVEKVFQKLPPLDFCEVPTPYYMEFLQSQSDKSYFREKNNFFYLKIDLANAKNSLLRDIEGFIILHNDRTNSGWIAQRSFKIGYPVSDEDFHILKPENLKLLPEWMSAYYNINLTRSACLTISPDRTDVIADDKLHTLRAKLTTEVMGRIEAHLLEIQSSSSRTDYVNYLKIICNTQNGFLVFFDFKQIASSSLIFLSKFLLVLAMTPEGKVTYLVVNELFKYSRLGIVVSARKPFVIDNMRQFCVQENFAIVIPNGLSSYTGTSLRHSLRALFEANNRFLLDNAITIVDALPDFQFELLVYDRVVRKSRIVLLEQEELDIFCLLENFSFRISINKQHPIFTDLNKQGREVQDLIKILGKRISKVMVDSVQRTYSETEHFLEVTSHAMTKSNEKNVYPFFAGIFKRDPGLLEIINSEIESFFETAKAKKLLSSKEDKIRKLTTKDFLPYWSEL
ncbi:MAG: ATP-binding protein [Bacteroidetes bacterium]|nr:ATP-binding protein [Bacteroidota bacterium]